MTSNKQAEGGGASKCYMRMCVHKVPINELPHYQLSHPANHGDTLSFVNNCHFQCEQAFKRQAMVGQRF